FRFWMYATPSRCIATARTNDPKPMHAPTAIALLPAVTIAAIAGSATITRITAQTDRRLGPLENGSAPMMVGAPMGLPKEWFANLNGTFHGFIAKPTAVAKPSTVAVD